MIRTMLLTGDGDIRMGAEDLITVWRQGGHTRIWIDIEDEKPEAEAALLRSLGCHDLVIQDAQRTVHPPKIEEFSDRTFILYRGIASFTPTLELQAQTLAMFIKPDMLITRHPHPAISVGKLYSDLGADLLRQSTGFLALKVMLVSSGLYLEALLEFETELSEIEDALLKQGSDELMGKLVTYRSRLVKLRRMFSYHKNITEELLSDDYVSLPQSEEAMRHAITDLHDRFDRLYTLTEMFYSICGDLIDGYLSITSHQLNQAMRVLTVITAIFVPLGFLAGLYGMNFDYIPELHIKGGYFILLAVMGTVAVGLLALFRKIRWL